MFFSGWLALGLGPSCSVFLGFDPEDYSEGQGASAGDSSGEGGAVAAGGAGGDASGGGPDEGSSLPKPTHHYPLDELSGSVAEDVAGEADAFASGPTAWTAGLVGNAFSLELDERYLEFPESVASTPDFTIAFWFNRASDAFHTIIDKRGQGSEGGFRLLHSQSTLTFIAGGEGRMELQRQAVGVLPPVNEGKWTHIAVSFDSNVDATVLDELTIWIDGELAESWREDFAIASVVNTATKMRFGRNVNNAPEQARGLLDDIQVFDRVLEASEVRALHEEALDSALR